jgi:hypothetical protein
MVLKLQFNFIGPIEVGVHFKSKFQSLKNWNETIYGCELYTLVKVWNIVFFGLKALLYSIKKKNW